MKSGQTLAIVLTSALMAASCSASGPAESELVSVECSDPRPEMCTRDYRPVCALRDSGIRCVTTPCPSTEWKTYSNGCSACADSEVQGYRPGTCEEM